MQTTEDGLTDNLASGCLLLRLFWWTGDVLVDALVRPRMVEVGLILLHCPIEMSLIQHQEEVQAFPPHVAQKSLTNGVGLRRLIGRGQNLNPAPIRHPGEGLPILVVVVVNQEARTLTAGRRLPQLLGHPAIIRASGHPKMHQPTRFQLDYYEDEDGAEEEVISLQKVAGPDILGMVAQKTDQVCLSDRGPRHQNRFPARQLAGQKHKQGTVTPGEGGTLHLSLQDDELLTQQGVFQHQFRSAAVEIQGRAYSQGIIAVIGACPLAQALFGPVAD
jgi:hypothetical protein